MNPREKYTGRLNEFTEAKRKLDARSNLLSNVRLLVFLAGTTLAVMTFIYINILPGLIISAIFLAAFLILVFWHDAVIKKSKRCGKLIEVNKMCLSRISGDWIDFADIGKEFTDNKHSYSSDLDIFGPASLFQLINCSNTFHGRDNLRKLLEDPDRNPGQIRSRQSAISELAGKVNFCQELQCEGLDIPELSGNPDELLGYFESRLKVPGAAWTSYVFYILPMLTLLSIVICLIDKSVSYLIPLVLLIIQAIINLIGYKVLISLKSVYSFRKKIQVYENLIGIIERENFKDQYLSNIKSAFLNNNKTALKQIRSLENIVNAVEAGSNFLFYLILNVLLFWNFHCAMALESWKEQSGSRLREWLENIGKMEALVSLAMVSQANPQWTIPDIAENKTTVTAVAMGHPLITADKRVCNDFRLEDSIGIITGSNMSGKSTLLRTAGINLVLAYAGAAVCAEKFECSVMDIYTSMRINDDLNSGVSTFYAELLRIRSIIEKSRTGKPMIFLIDEVFRGTNSRDRYAGAKNVLLNLNKKWIIGLISTHDFDLCELEKNSSGRIVNYHFTESYIDNRILFDYKLRPGRCGTTNAKYLMKMVGIEFIEE